MTRVLVTGAAGFIGSHVVDHCLTLGYDVVAVDDLSGGFTENVAEAAHFQRLNVTDAKAVAGLFAHDSFDYVYHLAAYAAEGLSHFIRSFNYRNNLIGSVNIINQAVLHDVRCLVFTSSIAVYGAAQTPMSEDTVPSPEDPYGISKFAVELDLRAARALFGLDYIIFRPHNVYGERQNLGDRYRNVIGIFMNQVMAGRPMTVFGDGHQTRAFSHVDDVAPVIARSPTVLEAFGQTFNVGADTPYSVLELAHEVAAAFGVSPDVTHLPPREEVVHAFASHARAAAVFGQSQPIALKDGIGRMAAWARQRGPTPVVSYDNIEIPRNLPPSWDLDATK